MIDSVEFVLVYQTRPGRPHSIGADSRRQRYGGDRPHGQNVVGAIPHRIFAVNFLKQ